MEFGRNRLCRRARGRERFRERAAYRPIELPTFVPALHWTLPRTLGTHRAMMITAHTTRLPDEEARSMTWKLGRQFRRVARRGERAHAGALAARASVSNHRRAPVCYSAECTLGSHLESGMGSHPVNVPKSS